MADLQSAALATWLRRQKLVRAALLRSGGHYLGKGRRPGRQGQEDSDAYALQVVSQGDDCSIGNLALHHDIGFSGGFLQRTAFASGATTQDRSSPEVRGLPGSIATAWAKRADDWSLVRIFGSALCRRLAEMSAPGMTGASQRELVPRKCASAPEAALSTKGFVMGLSQLFSGWIVKDSVADFAERVAGRSRQRVWQRIEHRIGSLAAAEARGYIRARAATIIDDELDKLIAQEGTKVAGNRDRISALASELLMQAILSSTHAARETRRSYRAAA
jgi:hypothetical protein